MSAVNPRKKPANDDQLDALLREYKQLGERSKQVRKQQTARRGKDLRQEIPPDVRKPEKPHC